MSERLERAVLEKKGAVLQLWGKPQVVERVVRLARELGVDAAKLGKKAFLKGLVLMEEEAESKKVGNNVGEDAESGGEQSKASFGQPPQTPIVSPPPAIFPPKTDQEAKVK